MDLRHQLAFLRSTLPLIIAGAILGAVSAFGVSSILPPTYQSQVTMLVGQASNPGTSADYNQLLISQRLSQTYAQLATLPKIAADVIEQLGLPTTPEDLLKRVTASAPLDSTLLTIVAEDGTPDGAAQIANAFVAELIKSPVGGQAAPTEVDALIQQDLLGVRSQIRDLESQIQALQTTEARTDAQEASLAVYRTHLVSLTSTLATLLSLSTGAAVNQLTIVNPGQPPLEPSSPRVLLNTALGGLLGLLSAIGIAYAMRRLDDTIKTPDDIEVATGLPLLGTIVRMPGEKGRALRYRLATLLYPRSPAAEGFRHIRTNVEFANGERPLRSLLIASSVPGEGKTITASNLAIAFAQAGRVVCLVDADLRRPAVHDVFGLPNDHGLASLLRGGEATFESATHETEVTGLRVMTTGPLPPNPAELLASPRMRAIVAGLLEKVELIVVDSPPLQAVTDAAVLSSLVDGTLLVAAAGRTRRGSLVSGRDALQRVGARVLGVMLNEVSDREGSGSSFAYFGYYGQPGASAAGGVIEPAPVFTALRADSPEPQAGVGNASGAQRSYGRHMTGRPDGDPLVGPGAETVAQAPAGPAEKDAPARRRRSGSGGPATS